MSEKQDPEKQDPEKQGVTLLTIVASMFAGWIGIQSKANRDRDFQHGKFSHFVIGGVIFLILFVLAVVGVVQLVVSSAGSTGS